MMIHHAGCQRCHMTLGTWVKRPRVAMWWTQITGVLLNASSSLFFFVRFLCVNKNTGGLLKPGWIQGTRSTSTQGCPWQGYPNWHPAPSSRYLDPGNLSAQLALRNTCLPWSWYMTKVTFPGKTFSSSQVAPLALKHHPAPPANLAWGEVYQVMVPSLSAEPVKYWTFSPFEKLNTSLAKYSKVYQGRMCWRPACLEPPCLLLASRDCNPVRGEVFRWYDTNTVVSSPIWNHFWSKSQFRLSILLSFRHREVWVDYQSSLGLFSGRNFLLFQL